MSETLQIDRSESGNQAGFTLTGEFTIYAAAEVHAAISDALGRAQGVRVDLSGVVEFDSSALQILRVTAREATERGVALEVTGHPPALKAIMTLMALGQAMEDSDREPSWT